MKKKLSIAVFSLALITVMLVNARNAFEMNRFSNLTLSALLTQASAHCGENPCEGPPYDGYWKEVGDCYDQWGQWNGCYALCWSTGSCQNCSDNTCDA